MNDLMNNCIFNDTLAIGCQAIYITPSASDITGDINVLSVSLNNKTK